MTPDKNGLEPTPPPVRVFQSTEVSQLLTANIYNISSHQSYTFKLFCISAL